MPRPLSPLPGGVQPLIRPMFRTMGIAASGLSAQRARMEIIAQNIANAETTRTVEGGPYKRQDVALQAAQPTAFQDAFAKALGVPPVEMPESIAPIGDIVADHAAGVEVAGIITDETEGPKVYQPGHPDADKDGYVHYPNVRITDEMVDLMDARRQYEANATVFQAAKQMMRRAIDI